MEELQKEGGCGKNMLAFVVAIGAFVAILLLGGGALPDQVMASSLSQQQGIPPMLILIVVVGVAVLVLWR